MLNSNSTRGQQLWKTGHLDVEKQWLLSERLRRAPTDLAKGFAGEVTAATLSGDGGQKFGAPALAETSTGH